MELFAEGVTDGSRGTAHGRGTDRCPTVSVVIPNYNGIAFIEDCLMALKEQSRMPDRVIVVDNGSEDGSAEVVEELFPEAELIRLEENTGFCGAVNVGIRASMRARDDGSGSSDESGSSDRSVDYVILLNNDTKVERDFVKELVRGMEKSPRIFSAQAKMLRMSEPDRMDDAGDLYCSLGWAFARGKGRPEREFDRPAEIFSACAGAAIYRMNVLKKIGLFDENHFAYLEDCDIGWRARIQGYQNVYLPRARVLHVGSASSGSIYNLFKVKNTSRNSIYVIAKNMPVWQVVLNLPLLVAGFVVKAVFFAEKGYGKEYLRGIGQGFRLSRQGRAEGRVVPYRSENLRNYVRIQLDMWANTVRRLLNR